MHKKLYSTNNPVVPEIKYQNSDIEKIQILKEGERVSFTHTHAQKKKKKVSRLINQKYIVRPM